MIETKEAVENLDEILSVPHLTGVYIGPADISISYGLKPKIDVKEEILNKAEIKDEFKDINSSFNKINKDLDNLDKEKNE